MLSLVLALWTATAAILLLTGVVMLRDWRRLESGPFGGLLTLSVGADCIAAVKRLTDHAGATFSAGPAGCGPTPPSSTRHAMAGAIMAGGGASRAATSKKRFSTTGSRRAARWARSM